MSAAEGRLAEALELKNDDVQEVPKALDELKRVDEVDDVRGGNCAEELFEALAVLAPFARLGWSKFCWYSTVPGGGLNRNAVTERRTPCECVLGRKEVGASGFTMDGGGSEGWGSGVGIERTSLAWYSPSGAKND